MSGGFQVLPEICNATDVGSVSSTSYGTAVSASSNAYGSWVQLTASSGIDACWMLIQVSNQNGWVTAQGAFEIGIGPAGSEQVIFPDLTSCTANGGFVSLFMFPCSIPKGTRIAVRAANCGSGTSTGNCAITLFDGAFDSSEGIAVDSIGFNGTSMIGSAIDPGATANTKGAYVQLTASTPRDYAGLCLGFDGLNANTVNAHMMIDIAIGASGSETIILPNIQTYLSGSTMLPAVTPIFWIPIPAGTRIAARAQCNTATLASRKFGLTGYGIYV